MRSRPLACWRYSQPASASNRGDPEASPPWLQEFGRVTALSWPTTRASWSNRPIRQAFCFCAQRPRTGRKPVLGMLTSRCRKIEDESRFSDVFRSVPRQISDPARQISALGGAVVNSPNRHADVFGGATAPDMSLSRLRILVVEDEGLIALNLELMLRRFGCEVVGLISDVGDIVDAVKKHRPDGIFLDVNL